MLNNLKRTIYGSLPEALKLGILSAAFLLKKLALLKRLNKYLKILHLQQSTSINLVWSF